MPIRFNEERAGCFIGCWKLRRIVILSAAKEPCISEINQVQRFFVALGSSELQFTAFPTAC